MKQYLINEEQLEYIHKMNPKMAHSILIGTQLQQVDDSVALVTHLSNIARQLVEDNVLDYDLPTTGGRFVWQRDFTSKEVSIELHKVGFYKPSLFYYEWTGAEKIEKLTEPGWLEDSINVYTEEEITESLPKNVGINPNVVEFGFKPGDNLATQKAKVMVYLLKNKMLKIDETGGK